jgi:hypothetical protein
MLMQLSESNGHLNSCVILTVFSMVVPVKT